MLLSLTACEQAPKENAAALSPLLKAGEELDQGKPAWLKLNDNFVLSVSPEFSQFWSDQNMPNNGFVRSIERPKNIPAVHSFGFVMFMPNFEGYNPDKHPDMFDEDKIQVGQVQAAPMSYAEPDAPGTYPPNMFKRASKGSFDIDKYEEKFGLRCYDMVNDPKGIRHQYCYGLRDKKLDEYILLDIIIPPYTIGTRYPIMQATYFTKQYGGLEITWRAHMRHFDRWQDIDHQIWHNIDSWNIATTKPATNNNQ